MAEEKGFIALKGRLFLTFKIEVKTGLHIGGAYEGIEIGGIDKTVIRNVLTNRPYIPGSSLRGKMRSLVEKYHGKKQNQRINHGYIHSCQDDDWQIYPTCEVCQAFGLPGEREFGTPTRLIVRDLHLDNSSAEDLDKLQTDLPYTEVKVEVAIDRVTSQANPRQIERVPAGVFFDGGELVYSLYEGAFSFNYKNESHTSKIDPRFDLRNFETVLEGLSLIEDDYLGAAGSRGSGRIQFTDLVLGFKTGQMSSTSSHYPAQPELLGKDSYEKLQDLRLDWDNSLKSKVESLI
jgi:CRISPR-associated protein Csm3